MEEEIHNHPDQVVVVEELVEVVIHLALDFLVALQQIVVRDQVDTVLHLHVLVAQEMVVKV